MEKFGEELLDDMINVTAEIRSSIDDCLLGWTKPSIPASSDHPYWTKARALGRVLYGNLRRRERRRRRRGKMQEEISVKRNSQTTNPIRPTKCLQWKKN